MDRQTHFDDRAFGRARADDWYRLLFQSSSDAIMILDRERFLDCNDATLDLFQVPDRETFCSLHPADLSPPKQYDGEPSLSAADARIREALENGQARFEWRHCRHHGPVFPAEVWLTRVGGADSRLLQATVRDLTDQKRMEAEIRRLNLRLEQRVAEQDAALRESEAKFRSLVEESMVGVYIIQDGLYQYSNPRMAEIFGGTREDVVGGKVTDFVAAQDHDLVTENIRRRIEGETKSIHYGFRVRRMDGEIIHVEVYGTVTSYNGRPAVIGTLLDVTDQFRARRELSLQKAYFQQLFENAPDGIVILDNREVVLDANPAFLELFGYALEELKGIPLNELIIPKERAREGLDLSRQVVGGETVEAETVRLRSDGTPVQVSIMGVPIKLHRDQIGIYGVYRDVSERHRVVREMAYQASHDALTGLHNRYEFESRAGVMLEEAKRSDRRHTMLYLDLDQFKVVNDTCGHPAGDELLRQLGSLMRTHTRESDTLARLGGDEFGVLLHDCPLARARAIADNLSCLVSDFRFTWEGRPFSVGASIGVVEINAGIRSVADLLKAADGACYAAKERGRNQVRVYHPQDRDLTRLQAEMSWVSGINSALEEGRLELHCQAIQPLRASLDRRPRWELLLRMRDEAGRLIKAEAFISAAERYGLMPSLDRWVLERAMAGIRREQDAGGSAALYAINVSGVTLSQGEFLEFVRDCISRHGIDASSLCFEITETAAIVSLSEAVGFVDAINGMGARMALDDFGTGLSSFAYLKTLNVDYLKIDGAFVKDMASDPIDEAMVETIHRVGRIMGIKTVAEFVESEAILERLRRIGVDYAQGYALHEPEPWQWDEEPAAGAGSSGAA